MYRVMCKAKIDNAVITRKDANYSGSIGIDQKILQATNIYPNEMVQVLNRNNGSRFETYVIPEKEGSGTIALFGPACRLGEVGDEIIILSKGLFEGKESPNVEIKIITLGKNNSILKK